MYAAQKKFAIILGAQQAALFVSLGRVLAEEYGHDVCFFMADPLSRRIVEKVAPQLAENVVCFADYAQEIPESKALSTVVALEERYDFKMNLFLSTDRGLGQGYNGNADRHPRVGKAYWSQEKKAQAFAETFVRESSALNAYCPDFVVNFGVVHRYWYMAEEMGARFVSLGIGRRGNKYILEDGMCAESQQLEERILANLEKAKSTDFIGEIKYEQYAQYKLHKSKLDYSYKGALKSASYQIAHDLYKILRRFTKKGGYPPFAWVPYCLRRAFCHAKLCKTGVMPEQLKGKRIVYFPLQMEPEISLTTNSPEFSNSYEAICWISKNLPADVVLVVKENPWSFGVRSVGYYDMLSKLSNVRWAHPESDSMDWIKSSIFVSVFTGTAGFESVYAKRPVLSFGKHQPLNFLPTVWFADSFSTVQEAVDNFFKEYPEESALNRSAYALHQSLEEATFEMSGFENNTYSQDFQQDQARRFADWMLKLYN